MNTEESGYVFEENSKSRLTLWKANGSNGPGQETWVVFEVVLTAHVDHSLVHVLHYKGERQPLCSTTMYSGRSKDGKKLTLSVSTTEGIYLF